ncbi:MAG TPA: DMT family transporter [Longimicrobiaceae bacterium]|nr:DMT family transporter [Longimicrobiaceae bacterium]
MSGRTALAAVPERPPVPPPLVLLVSVLAISWAAPLVRFAEAPSLAVAFWRLALSVVLIAGVLTARGEWGALRRLSRRDLGTAALAGVFLAGHFATWIASIGLTSVAASVVLVSTAPIFVAVLSALFLRERPGRRQWAGIGVAVAGAAWIGWGDFRGGADPLRGDLLALAGALLVAAYYVLGRRLRARIEIWPFVGVVYGCAALALLAALPLAGVPLGGYPPADWAVFAGLAVGPMLVGHTGQNWALRYLPAYVVNLSLLGEPVGATLIAWLLPGIAETPPPAALVGGGLILVGILLGMGRR